MGFLFDWSTVIPVDVDDDDLKTVAIHYILLLYSKNDPRIMHDERSRHDEYQNVFIGSKVWECWDECVYYIIIFSTEKVIKPRWITGSNIILNFSAWFRASYCKRPDYSWLTTHPRPPCTLSRPYSGVVRAAFKVIE